jgi:RNA polymerase sigma factor (sigma-70 family)
VRDDRLEDRRDADLHRRLSMGDRPAFEELYRRYSAAAFGLSFRVTGHEGLAQDVVHDSYLALWRAPEAYDPARGSFRAFFLSLVHHRAVDLVRKEERQRRLPERLNPDPATDEDVAETVVDQAWLGDRRAQVIAALRELPPEQRLVIERAYFDGLTQAAIARELNIPLGTVKTRTLSALRKLNRLLAEPSADTESK